MSSRLLFGAVHRMHDAPTHERARISHRCFRVRLVIVLASLISGCFRASAPCPGGVAVHTSPLDVCITYAPIPADFECPIDYPERFETCGCCAACAPIGADPTRVASIIRGVCPPPIDGGS